MPPTTWSTLTLNALRDCFTHPSIKSRLSEYVVNIRPSNKWRVITLTFCPRANWRNARGAYQVGQEGYSAPGAEESQQRRKCFLQHCTFLQHSAFFNTVYVIPKDLRFEHGGLFYPGRHLTSVRPCVLPVLQFEVTLSPLLELRSTWENGFPPLEREGHMRQMLNGRA